MYLFEYMIFIILIIIIFSKNYIKNNSKFVGWKLKPGGDCGQGKVQA